jgi:uncharacterized protein HemY
MAGEIKLFKRRCAMCFSMEEYERLRKIVKERKKLKERMKNLKPSDFEKKANEKWVKEREEVRV